MPDWMAWALLGWTLLALTLIDHRNFLPPDVLVPPLLAGLAATYFIAPESLSNHVIGAWVGGHGVLTVVLYAALAERADTTLPFGAYLALAAWLAWSSGRCNSAASRCEGVRS